MLVFGTEMHVITFIFLIIEVLLLFNLWIASLSTPFDQAQKNYLILLSLLVVYNLTGGLFPDPKIPIPIYIQNIFAYASGFGMCMYAPYYFYKVYNLKQMRFHAKYGIFLFLLIPFLIFFVVFYAFYQDLEVAREWGVIIPFFYALSIIYSMTKSIFYDDTVRKSGEVIALYAAIIPWISLTIVTYLNGSQAVEVSIVNSGMIVVTVLFIRKYISQIRQAEIERQSYHLSLQESNIHLEQANLELENANLNLEEKVIERTRELMVLNEMRMNTFANLAHEIRTPLTLLRDYLKKASNQYPDIKQIQFANKYVYKLTKDITNLFDLIKSEKGIHLYEHNQITNFSHILEERLELFAVVVERSSLQINSQIEGEVYINANATALERIANNLLDNAIKYSSPGTTITVSLRLDKDHSKVIFTVSDQGEGITEDNLDLIFKPYQRISQKNTEGMGMGLPIVKLIVESLKGSIAVQSGMFHGYGTSFIIELPYTPLVGSEEAITQPYFKKTFQKVLEKESQRKDINQILDSEYSMTDRRPFKPESFTHSDLKKTILIIDDNSDMLRFILNNLKDNYNTYHAISGYDALEKLTVIPVPDLIVSDVMMPEMGGFELRKEMLKSSLYRSIPFLFLSARQEDKIQGLELKAIDFIDKPFEIEELIGKINSIIYLSEQKQSAVLKSVIDASMRQYGSMQTGIQDSSLRIENKKEATLEDKINTLGVSLTSNQINIVKYLIDGKTAKEIGDMVGRSPRTVEKTVALIYRQFEVGNLKELLKKINI
ncbi:ATP-binding protein [Cytophagaceae bacterium DM2B3-1]|uniref:histidine kinase n=1 Tax=Xanthocytophaga flava TaxID=3048013 RepID=A0ABT7CXC0_9BACT|nr:ATP-binding protein [Xanthocytophaga flavus]MDJ1497615.1 ATP-binding protein [Xanthocytophaga flavus]